MEILSKDKPPTQRAPRYPVVMMEAFEHVVEDDSQRIGFRLVAWVKVGQTLGNITLGRCAENHPEGTQVLWRAHDNHFENNQDDGTIETGSGASCLCLRTCFYFESFMAEDWF